MRYLVQFLQMVRSKTGDAGLLRARVQGFLQLGWVQQRPLWVLISLLIPLRIPVRNETEGLGRRTPFGADLQRIRYHPHNDRLVSGRSF